MQGFRNEEILKTLTQNFKSVTLTSRSQAGMEIVPNKILDQYL